MANATPEEHNATALAALEAVLQQGRDEGRQQGYLRGLRRAKSILEDVLDKVDKEIAELTQPVTSSAQYAGASESLKHDLALPIEDLGLKVRTYNFLIRNDIRTIGDLVKQSEYDLSCIRYFGLKGIEDVKLQLGGMGLSLKDDAQA